MSPLPLDPTTSRAVQRLRFPLMVGVVGIHAFAAKPVPLDLSFPFLLLRETLVEGLFRVSVPAFFLLSGFLFFWAMPLDWPSYREKWKSRGRTLLVPYLLWMTANLLFLLLVQNLPGVGELLSGSKKAVLDYGLFDGLDAFIGLVDPYPVAYHFWFIRDLIMLVALSPLLGWVLARWPLILLGLVGAAWFIPWPRLLYPLSWESLLFFLLGAWLAMARLERTVSRGWLWAWFLLAPAVGTLESLSSPLAHYLGQVNKGVGLLAVWGLACHGMAGGWMERWLFAMAPWSFWIFAAHEPLLGGLKRISYRLLQPGSESMGLLLDVAVWVGTLGGAWALGRLLLLVSPALVGLLSGRRLAPGGRG